ncbi:MaoC/PaaZ C-terminal domain-containing protein [Aquisphaera insulae]|uniref:MaoC/PaaZ C-terminal domain-containing protein n=1 Tax=Aquisphaera insulae TaxID=2712864 RepID=UPI0013ED9270|nr:MaoC/PaaZ C-terminal domain-containing protein [Aquisphaera insulae]
MARIITEPLTVEQLSVGDEWQSPGRTVTETDVVIFAGLSGDYNALHCNHIEAGKGPFGRRVAHGLLGMAIATGLASQAPRVQTLAFLGIQDWRFLLPVHFGDTILVVSRVAGIEIQARGRRGIVTWNRQVLNQEGKVVQEGQTRTLVKGKERPRASEGDEANRPG